MPWLAIILLLLLLRLLLGCLLRRWRARTDAPELELPPQGSLAPSGCPDPPPAPLQTAPPAALLARREGPCPLPTFLQLVQQQVAELGLGARQLSSSELAALARRAGFADGQAPGQAPLRPATLQHFAAWFGAQLAVLQALGPGVYAYQQAQLVCGFDVGRAEAEAALAAHGFGTFCLRLGSMPGCLVVSVLEAPGIRQHCRRIDGSSSSSGGTPQGGSGGYGPTSSSSDEPAVSHYLFGAYGLHMVGLSRALAQVPGCDRLLDVRSGRTHRPSILRKAAAAARLPAAPSAASISPNGSR